LFTRKVLTYLEDVNIYIPRPPNMEKVTRRGMIQAILPRVLSPNVCRQIVSGSIRFRLRVYLESVYNTLDVS
jgi:hypothetical protein